MTILVKRWLVLVAGLLVVATGCSKKNVSHSEFMGKYDVQKNSADFVYVKPATDFFSYDKVMMETLMAFKRAGADIIITYHAKEAAELLQK